MSVKWSCIPRCDWLDLSLDAQKAKVGGATDPPVPHRGKVNCIHADSEPGCLQFSIKDTPYVFISPSAIRVIVLLGTLKSVFQITTSSMSIRALNQNSPSLNFAANAEGQGPCCPFFRPHGGEYPYSNKWYLQSGSDQPGHPGHPYLSPWAETGDKDQDNEANDNSWDTTNPRKPYQCPGPAEVYPPHNFPSASEGRKPCPFPGYPQQPYTYPVLFHGISHMPIPALRSVKSHILPSGMTRNPSPMLASRWGSCY